LLFGMAQVNDEGKAGRGFRLPASLLTAGLVVGVLFGLAASRETFIRMTASRYLKLGTDFNRGEKYSRAIPFLRRAAALRPTDYRIYRESAVSLARVNMLDAAAWQLETGLAYFPGSADLLSRLGLVRAKAKNFPGAVSALKEALAMDPGREAAWNNLGRVYYQMSEERLAAACFKRLAELRLARGNYPGARRAVEKASLIYPTLEGIWALKRELAASNAVGEGRKK